MWMQVFQSEAYSAEPMSSLWLIISLQGLKISLVIVLTNNKHIFTIWPPMMTMVDDDDDSPVCKYPNSSAEITFIFDHQP